MNLVRTGVKVAIVTAGGFAGYKAISLFGGGSKLERKLGAFAGAMTVYHTMSFVEDMVIPRLASSQTTQSQG
jgi:hypothetical protein